MPSRRVQLGVDETLFERVDAAQHVGDLAVDVPDGGLHALAEVAIAAVAQLDGFVLTGRGARGHGGTTDSSTVEFDLDFHGGIASGIEDLAADDVDDFAHENTR